MTEEEAWSRIERIHRPLLAEGEEVHLHFMPREPGTIRNPRIPGATSYYAIVNGLKVEFPVHVNADDMVTIVGVGGVDILDKKVNGVSLYRDKPKERVDD